MEENNPTPGGEQLNTLMCMGEADVPLTSEQEALLITSFAERAPDWREDQEKSLWAKELEAGKIYLGVRSVNMPDDPMTCTQTIMAPPKEEEKPETQQVTFAGPRLAKIMKENLKNQQASDIINNFVKKDASNSFDRLGGTANIKNKKTRRRQH